MCGKVSKKTQKSQKCLSLRHHNSSLINFLQKSRQYVREATTYSQFHENGLKTMRFAGVVMSQNTSSPKIEIIIKPYSTFCYISNERVS